RQLNLGKVLGAYLTKNNACSGSDRSICSTIDFSQPVQLELSTRSTEGVIYFLGEIIRRQIDQGKGTVKFTYTNHRSCERKPIFVLERYDVKEATSGRSPLEVKYEGNIYKVPKDQKRAGMTSEVLSVVMQLIALHKSAKSLPTSSVFTLVGQ